MANQQSKRRRKRYQPGSAYAGHVRPTGALSVLSSARTIRVVFILMALALAGGGLVGVFGTGAFGGGSGRNPQGFQDPGDDDTSGATPQPGDTVEMKQYSGPPPMSIDPEERYVATIETELGKIQVELLAEQAPQTVNNFVFLVRDGFYDGLLFHYVQEGFSVQAGDPACTSAQAGTTACRGDGGPGYELPKEEPGPFAAGTLGMVNGSQFFIALTGSEQFEDFTPFGRVISGLEVAEQLEYGTAIQTIGVQEQ